MNSDKRVNPKLELICTSKNGVPILYDPVYSHAATHLEDTPQLKDLVTELAAAMELVGQKIAAYYDMGRIVGTSDVVAVDETDEIVYGLRKNRKDDGLVPFVKTRPGDPSSEVAIQLLPQADGSYILVSAWIGTFDDDEPFPLSPLATDNSADYWNRYAFVYGSQEMISGTETKVRPW